MEYTSSSDSAFMSRSLRPGTHLSSSRNTLCSRRSLYRDTFDRHSVRDSVQVNLLHCKGLLWIVSTLTHANNTIVDQGLDVTESMNSTPEMTSMMYKRICDAPVAGTFEIWSEQYCYVFGTYTFFLGPSCRASV